MMLDLFVNVRNKTESAASYVKEAASNVQLPQSVKDFVVNTPSYKVIGVAAGTACLAYFSAIQFSNYLKQDNIDNNAEFEKEKAQLAEKEKAQLAEKEKAQLAEKEKAQLAAEEAFQRAKKTFGI